VSPLVLALLRELDPGADLLECVPDGPGYRVRARARSGGSARALLLTSTLERAHAGDDLARHILGATLRTMLLSAHRAAGPG
jgi:hypothetical protein